MKITWCTGFVLYNINVYIWFIKCIEKIEIKNVDRLMDKVISQITFLLQFTIIIFFAEYVSNFQSNLLALNLSNIDFILSDI